MDSWYPWSWWSHDHSIGFYDHKKWIVYRHPKLDVLLLGLPWKITFFKWVNHIFLWPFSIAMLVYWRVVSGWWLIGNFYNPSFESRLINQSDHARIGSTADLQDSAISGCPISFPELFHDIQIQWLILLIRDAVFPPFDSFLAHWSKFFFSVEVGMEIIWVFPKMVVPQKIINFYRVYHYKPSILGYHHLWKPPYIAFNLGLPAQAVTCDVCQRWLVQMQQIEPQGLSQKDFFGVSIVMGVPQQLDGLFHGKS